MEPGLRTVEVPISLNETIHVEGLQRDRRRRNDLRITLPDGRVVLAHGRRPTEGGWEVYFEDLSDIVGGTTLSASIALLMGWKFGGEEPDWLDVFDAAVK
jgi:hypothetical protein